MAPSSPDELKENNSPPRGARPKSAPAAGASPAREPRVWLVLGDKRGDNGQVEVVAAALGWACQRKQLAMRARYVPGKPRVRPSLPHIDPERSDALEPPWPDLIVTVGRRPSMAALWIREQSGGHAKIVQIGKPSGRVEWYDLVIASSEIVMPPLPNVLAVSLPLMQVDRTAIADAGAFWEPRLAELPRPLVACLIGGPTVPYRYDGAMAERLSGWAGRHMAETGGTVYFTTSRRTPERLTAALQAALPGGARLFAWTPEASQNPYRGLLALADGFVVTGDSISMMVEVLKAGKPLAIFPLATGPLGTLDLVRRALVRRLFEPDPAGPVAGLRPALGRLLYRLRLAAPTRDFRNFHRLLQARGLAGPLDRPARPAGAELPDDLPAIVARIKSLLGAP
jgi:mitochondrial fission protein ELM1